MNLRSWCVLLTTVWVGSQAVADERADYIHRSAERYAAMFRFADFDKSDVVSWDEARGIVELQARFNDIDIDRDGNITRNELTRYMELTFR